MAATFLRKKGSSYRVATCYNPLMKVAVIGCGYVGLSTAVVLADLGHFAIGVEIDPDRLGKLIEGKPPIYEEHLEELMRRCIDSGHLKFTDQHTSAAIDADAIIIAVGTPPGKPGKST